MYYESGQCHVFQSKWQQSRFFKLYSHANPAGQPRNSDTIHPQAEIIEVSVRKNICVPFIILTNMIYSLFYKLRKLIQKEQPDCIITHSYRARVFV